MAIKIKYIIKVTPGMRITQIEVNDVRVSVDSIPSPVNNEIKGEVSFDIGMDNYFEFRMDGVGDILAVNTKGSINFEYEDKKVLQNDIEFVVKQSGTIRLYVPSVIIS